MSHITRGSRNNFDNDYNGNLFVSGSMKEDIGGTTDIDYNGNLFVSGSMKEDIGGTTDIESLREGTIIVDGIMDNLRLSDINIACDAALDQDVSQEIGFLGEQERMDFFSYEEERDRLEREFYGVCECCNGTGHYWDCDPHRSRKVPCDNCNGTGFIKDHDA